MSPFAVPPSLPLLPCSTPPLPLRFVLIRFALLPSGPECCKTLPYPFSLSLKHPLTACPRLADAQRDATVFSSIFKDAPSPPLPIFSRAWFSAAILLIPRSKLEIGIFFLSSLTTFFFSFFGPDTDHNEYMVYPLF